MILISIVLARILGTLYLSFFFGLLFNRKYYNTALPALVQNQGYLILSGFMAIVFGMLILTYHNLWLGDWSVIITLFGWIALLKGIFFIVFPALVSSLKDSVLHENNLRYFLPILLLMGLFFGYFGFISELI